jgi:hypothetical protein
MQRIRIQKPKPKRQREFEVLPLDPRDPDVLRAKAIARARRGETPLVRSEACLLLCAR